MSASNGQRLVQHIRRLAGAPPDTSSDGELLRRYLDAGDEAAFAALVRRLGPMVFAVCQSVLRQRDDAEDASQAVFLILAQKAGSIRRQEGLGGWLQRIAYHVALRARARTAQRQIREANATPPMSASSTCDDLSWSEMRAILHAELAALPEHFRIPLVLCYLEGLTQEEAARRLGCTAATVKGRLQRGRDKLRRRLERRGIALTAALGAALTAQALAETAVRSAGLLTRTSATTAATALACEYLRPLLPLKLVMLSGLLLSMGVGMGGLALHSPPTEPRPSGNGERDRSLMVAAPKEAVDAHGDPLPKGAVARLGTIRFNHGDGLTNLLFSRDGKMILSKGSDSMCLWDAATGTELGRFSSAKAWFDDGQIVLRPDGKTIVSLFQEFTGDVVHEWDVATKKEIRRRILPVRRGELSVYRRNALSPDGRLGAINLPTEMRIFDLTTGRELYQLAKGGKDVRDVVFAGGDRLVTADTKQTIDVWEARTGKLLRSFDHGSPAAVLATPPDGRWLATLEHHVNAIDRWLDKDVVHVWDLSTGTKKHTLAARPKRWFMSVYFSPDGKRLLASSDGAERSELSIWDTETGERIREIEDASGKPLAVSPDGSRLASGNLPGKFELWDMKTGRRLSTGDSRHARASALAFAPTDDRIVLLGFRSLSSWETTTGRRKEVFDLPRIPFYPPRPALSPDGKYALSHVGDFEKCQSFIWDVVQRRRLRTLKTRREMGAFSPDSSLLATWETGKATAIRICDVATGREVRSFPAHNVAWPLLSFTADGKTLLTASDKIAGYEVSSGKELFSWRMKPLPDNSGMRDAAVGGQPGDPQSRRTWRGITVSPDGTRVAVTLDGGFGRRPLRDRLALFDAQTGKLLRRWSDSGESGGNYEQLCFSHDSQLLASSDKDALHLWEVATGNPIRSFRGHRNEIEFLAFSHDDRRLASASSDSTVLIWDTTGSPGNSLTDAALADSWQVLGGDDARRAHDAVWTLARTPAKSIPFLQTRLRPVKAVPRERLEQWIKDLDSDQFTIREKATKELQGLGELAELAVRRALEDKPTLEQRRRLEPILADLDTKLPSGEALRSLRAVRALEYAGTAEARELLRELATGAEGATLTRAARGALRRLDRSSSKWTP